ncbi:2-hydroxyacid dehydrogenase [Jiangella asiatica]|uniref:D-glycerate dehydrogenase n=1 Tax=Jiangella asiatica TaxID=2530372 RepID=A0A4R5CR28_9ACTN|nr:D-glycerate dehydrogenase [Jiangella asiatica]TDE00155.1 D-glycerate dehydrogenase [Jiangella asiatica]
MTPRVVVSQYVFPEAVDQLRRAGFDVEARNDDEPLPPEQLQELVRGAAGLVSMLTDRIDADFLASAPDLSVVANVAVGYDNIDVAAATRAGIAVCNTPDVLTDATADLTWSLILATARRVPEGDAFLRAGRYTHWKLAQEQLGADVFGQSLGIYGFGKIGQAVARRAVGGFDMTVRYHDAHRLPRDRERELGVTYAEMDELLATADFLSVHAPLTESTRHGIDATALARMKPSAILVNTARGPIVDEAALVEALATGSIAGAGLDVYEDEPTVHPGLVEQRERVVLLPHLGSATASTRRRMAAIAVGNVIDALSGRRPRTLVNTDVRPAVGATSDETGA